MTPATRLSQLRTTLQLDEHVGRPEFGQQDGGDGDDDNNDVPQTREAVDLTHPNARSVHAKASQPLPLPSQTYSVPSGESVKDMASQITFLQDIVKRLSGELASYQSQYPYHEVEPSQIPGLKDDDPPPVWLTNPARLNPLLYAYDERCHGLEGKLERYESKLSTLKKESQSVVKENEQLRTQLNQQSAQAIIMPAVSDKSMAALDRTEEVQQLRLSRDENEILSAELASSRKLVDALQTDARKRSQEIFALTQTQNTLLVQVEQLKATKQKLETQLTAASADVTHLQSELHEMQDQFAVLQRGADGVDTAELFRKLQEVTARYKLAIEDLRLQAVREAELLQLAKGKEDELLDLKSKHSTLNRQFTTLSQDQVKILGSTQALESRIQELERKELESFERVEAGARQLEEMRIERDRAVAKEEYLQREVGDLKKRVTDTNEKAAVEQERRLDEQKKHYEERSRGVAEEINMLQVKCANLQHQVERAHREKRTVESELESIKKSAPGELERLNNLVEELHTKLRSSERERLSASHQLESVQGRIAREETRHEKEKQALVSQIDSLTRSLRRSEHDLTEIKEARITLLSKISELETHTKELESQGEKAQRQSQNDIRATSRKYETKVQELTTQLRELQTRYEQATRDTQHLLSEQQRTGLQWKEEAGRMTRQYDTCIADLKRQLSALTNKNEQLSQQADKAAHMKAQVIQQMTEEKKALLCSPTFLHLPHSNARLAAMLQSAEQRLEMQQEKIQEMLAAQSEMTQKQRLTQRELDRITTEKSRLERDCRYLKSLQNNLHSNLRSSLWPTSLSDEGSDGDDGVVDEDEELDSEHVRALKVRLEHIKNMQSKRKSPVRESVENETKVVQERTKALLSTPGASATSLQLDDSLADIAGHDFLQSPSFSARHRSSPGAAPS
ncbi:hypothetical protein RI367_001247 [Sorochytrium milnesiophthora]